jgi:predicted O-methyltransferase YrrM
MTSYDLSHLTQPEKQNVVGPIQDDEALFLYSLIRTMRLKRILEIGGDVGYSATNFLKAIGGDGIVYTVDLKPTPSLAKNHKVIVKNALLLEPADIDQAPLDLIFFDCHEYNVQMSLFIRLQERQIINDHTVLALHDTNLHPQQFVPWAYPVEGGYVHQPVERRMSNDFKRMGYDVLSLHTRLSAHDEMLPFRHGLTVCQKFRPMKI